MLSSSVFSYAYPIWCVECCLKVGVQCFSQHLKHVQHNRSNRICENKAEQPCRLGFYRNPVVGKRQACLVWKSLTLNKGEESVLLS